MCGRFTVTVDPNDLMTMFHLEAAESMLVPRYNVAPTQNTAVVLNETPGTLSIAQWGLIPSWAKDPSIGTKMINARAETLEEKPSFRTAFKKRRCLVLADGFYEWRKEPDGKTKTPLYITLEAHRPFAMAGLWELWTSQQGEQHRTFTIVTTAPNDLMAPIHNRMPVILPPEDIADWLDDSTPALALTAMLKPLASIGMKAYPVSRRVNFPANDDASLIYPV